MGAVHHSREVLNTGILKECEAAGPGVSTDRKQKTTLSLFLSMQSKTQVQGVVLLNLGSVFPP